jgi:hypothetical protein
LLPYLASTSARDGSARRTAARVPAHTHPCCPCRARRSCTPRWQSGRRGP